MRKESTEIMIMEEPEHIYYPIRPRDIDIKNLFSTFGKCEIETAASHLISFFQEKGCWCQFTVKELLDFYERSGKDSDEMLFGLAGQWFDDGPFVVRNALPCLVHMGDGYAVTEFFIKRCAKIE